MKVATVKNTKCVHTVYVDRLKSLQLSYLLTFYGPRCSTWLTYSTKDDSAFKIAFKSKWINFGYPGASFPCKISK